MQHAQKLYALPPQNVIKADPLRLRTRVDKVDCINFISRSPAAALEDFEVSIVEATSVSALQARHKHTVAEPAIVLCDGADRREQGSVWTGAR